MTIHSDWKTPSEHKLTEPQRRAALLRIARAIFSPERLSEAARDALIEEWAAICPHPAGSDLLLAPAELGCESSPEAIIECAFRWEPRTIAMQIKHRLGGAEAGYYLYELAALGTQATQVVTSLAVAYEPGAIVAVALKGVELSDGSIVTETCEFGPASCGKILGSTDQPIGARV